MCIKKRIQFLLLLSIFLMNTQLQATHIMGSDITYRCLGNNKYEVTLTVYRDCNGILMSNTPVKASCNSGTRDFTFPLISRTDVTGIDSQCLITSRCSGSYKYGIQEHVYKGTIDLDTFNCCEVTLSWEACCRNSNITTGAANANFYTEAVLNKCLAACNSSPIFTSKPAKLIYVGQDFIFNNGALDTVDVGDSLSYKLAEPLQGKGSKINYFASWGAQQPITFLGFPNANLKHPGGFRLNPVTGDLSFRPTIQNEVVIIVLEVTEWSKINGIMTKVGSTQRNIQFIVIGDNNKRLVYFDNLPRELPVCSLSGTLCKDISLLRNSKVNDTIKLEYNHNLQNITFTNVGTFAIPKIKVCYTPTIAEVNSGKPLTFAIRAITKSCPLNVVSEREFEWAIKPQLPDSFAIKKVLSCKHLKISFENKMANAKNTRAIFEVKSASGVIREETSTLQIEELKDTGWYTIKMLVEDYGFCSNRIYYDSIYVPINNFLDIQIPNDTLLCNIATLSIHAKPINGAAPYTYTWTGDDTSSQQLLNTPINKAKNSYTAKITDKNGCIVTKTTKVRYYNPTASLSGTTKACAGDTINIEAQLKDTIKPIYGWVGFAQGQTKFQVVVSQNSSLAFTVKDSSGCNNTQTHFIRVYAPKVSYGHNDVYCESDSIVLSAVAADGLAPYSINWQPFSLNTDTVPLGHQKRGTINIITTVTDAFGCKRIQQQSIKINPTPDIQYQPVTTVCESDDTINLINHIKPQKGIWSGEGVSSNYFRPYSVQPGKKKLTYFYLDSLSFCSNQITTEIEVDAHPVADFVVDSLQASPTHNFQFTNNSRYGDKHQFLWDFGDPQSGNANTSSQKNGTHIFSDTGEYTIKLLLSGGSCPSDSIIKSGLIKVYKVTKPDSTTTAIYEIEGDKLHIYPNPASDNINIESSREILAISIHDVLGRLVFTKKLTGSKEQSINTQNLPKGVYTVSVDLANNRQQHTIVLIER